MNWTSTELINEIAINWSLVVQIKHGEGHIEKWVLRKAYDEDRPYLLKVWIISNETTLDLLVGINRSFLLMLCAAHLIETERTVQWRSRYNWIDGLKGHAAQHVSWAVSCWMIFKSRDPFAILYSYSMICVSLFWWMTRWCRMLRTYSLTTLPIPRRPTTTWWFTRNSSLR